LNEIRKARQDMKEEFNKHRNPEKNQFPEMLEMKNSIKQIKNS
jgi:hypothetical protein